MVIGSCLGDRYEIIEMIGTGGMATVYRGYDNILNREVAVKILRQDLALNEHAVKRFRREAQSALTLSHPNIVSIYDVGEDLNTYYIVMEYIKGFTLKEYIQTNGPLALEEALPIMRQISSAILHAHENQIIHRDIKPQNILIDSYGHVKITDFGIAMLLQAATMTQTNTTIGSVHYLSPEQAKGSTVTIQTDIYSMGILFYELLIGRPPFQGDSAVAVALHHIQTPTPSICEVRPEIPQSVENIILKATTKDLAYRYKNMDELIHDLDTCLLPEKMNELPYRPEQDDLDKTRAIAATPFREAYTKEMPAIQPERQPDAYAQSGMRRENPMPAQPVHTPWIKVRKNQVLLAFLAILIVVIGVALWLVFIKDTTKEIEIPDLKNMTLEEARLELETKNISIDDVIEQNNEEIEEGKIIKTNPSAGTMIKENFPIILYVSLGMEKMKVDSYVGLNYIDLKDHLVGMYKEVQVTEEVSDQLAGTILRQTPEKGEEVILSDTVLTLVVAKEAPKPKEVQMIDLKGKTLSYVESFANQNALLVAVEEAYSDEIGEGKVISYTPGMGSTLREKDTIHVVISKGEEEKPPKTVYIQVSLPFDPTLEQEVQKVVIYIKDLNRVITQPALTFDITEDTEESFEMSIPYGQTGEYRIVREGNVIQQKTVQYPE